MLTSIAAILTFVLSCLLATCQFSHTMIESFVDSATITKKSMLKLSILLVSRICRFIMKTQIASAYTAREVTVSGFQQGKSLYLTGIFGSDTRCTLTSADLMSRFISQSNTLLVIFRLNS